MRILLASNYQPPHMGGIEFAAEALKRCWERDGHEVTWISTDLPRGGRPETEDNIRIRCFNGFERWLQVNTPFPYPGQYGRVAQAVDQHEVVCVHSLAPGLTAAVLRNAVRMRKPTVVTQHVGIIPLRADPLRLAQDYYLRHKAEWAVKHGANLTFVGHAVRHWFLENTRISETSVTMTPAGIEPEVYYFVPDEERPALREKWGLKKDQIGMLFVGRFYEKKGLNFILAAAERCPDVQFTLVGSGPVDVESRNLPNVRIVGFVSSEELRELYGCHDLFLMPSVGEGWPAVIPQAMACGTACMISEEAFEGYAQDPDRFIVIPRDVDVIVENIRKLQDGQLALASDRKALSDYSIETWNWMKTARIYVELWNEQRDD